MSGKFSARWRFLAAFALAWSVASIAHAGDKPRPSTVALLASDFQYLGDWSHQNDKGNITVLNAMLEGGRIPAATAVNIPAAGQYRLLVCTRDFPNDRPGTRTAQVSVGGKRSTVVFGKHSQDGYAWEEGGLFTLPQGPVLITIEGKPFARVQGIVLTTDPALKLTKPLGQTNPFPPTTRPSEIRANTPDSHPVEEQPGAQPAAVLANDHVRIEFMPARAGGQATVVPHVKVKKNGTWSHFGGDPSAEGYFVVVAAKDAALGFSGFYPQWKRGGEKTTLTVEVRGVKVTTASGLSSSAMWDAGSLIRLTPKSAKIDNGTIDLEFYPTPAGQARATWELPPEQHAAKVTLSFIPAKDGQVALGYRMFFRQELANVSELLLPMMWQRKRFPEFDTTLLDNVAPAPLALAQPSGEPRCFAVMAEPADLPYHWPDGTRARHALSIRAGSGIVQPSIWGPIIGTPAAVAHPGKKVQFRFRVLACDGDWYSGFRTASDEVYGLGDYRRNVATSMTDAALNMIDLLMDDEHTGWWDRAKAFYQIESKNGSTHASPLLPLSIYRLTGDEQIYRKRALPTMQFMLSREGAHFSPVPDDTGIYPAGSMNGPVKLFGTATYGGLWELSGRRTAAMHDIAIPAGNAKITHGYSHVAGFDDWLAQYQLTGDRKDLDKACELADAYIKKEITTPPARDLGPMPFFFIQFTPAWEGLLRMYEATGKKHYLDAAVFGARQLMTGIWVQPPMPQGEITIHPDGQYGVDQGEHQWWKGPVQYRLGWPRHPGDTPTKSVPAWIVSNIGLGFEQPSTVRSKGLGRLIFQHAWSPHFLRLYRYTGDKTFLTYARNAAVGRWGNYPGYYITGFTDVMQNPKYPLAGPDVTDFYYHHVPPHLAWTIDYLASEAEMLSGGKISFPATWQYGYAYFDSRIFGHAPGKVFDDDGAWLRLRRGLVLLDNIQVNYLTAISNGKMHVILMNQSPQPEKVTLTLGPEALNGSAAPAVARLRLGHGAATEIPLAGGKATVEVPARGLAVLSVSGLGVKVSAPLPAAKPRSGSAVVAVRSGATEARAAAITVRPGAWDAYIWCTASPKQAKSVTFRYAVNEKWQEVKDTEYPFELSVPVPSDSTPVKFKVDVESPGGQTVTLPEGTVRLAD